MAQEVIYGTLHDELLLIPREKAEELAAVHTALNTAKTWGEFMALLPAAARTELEAFCAEEDESRPEDTRQFARDDVPGVQDGDWPGWPAQMMLEWVPKEIQQTYGKVDFSPVSGDCLTLDSSQTDVIVAVLEQHGYACIRDDELVVRASGAA